MAPGSCRNRCISQQVLLWDGTELTRELGTPVTVTRWPAPETQKPDTGRERGSGFLFTAQRQGLRMGGDWALSQASISEQEARGSGELLPTEGRGALLTSSHTKAGPLPPKSHSSETLHTPFYSDPNLLAPSCLTFLPAWPGPPRPSLHLLTHTLGSLVLTPLLCQ